MNAVKRAMTSCLERFFSESCRLSVLLFVLLFSSSSYSACTDWIARVVSIQGSVDVRIANAAEWKPVALQQTYCSGDTLRVQANSRAALELHNDTILRLNQNTTLVLSGPKKEASWLDLLKGSLHSISRVPRSLKIKTPFVNAAVEGTEFLVQVASDNTLVGVIEGKVAVANEYGRILLAKDQSAITYKGKAPVLRLDIRPADSVQWSLYYPSLNVAALKPAEDLLRVGQVDAAGVLLQGQDGADALALRSVIAIAKNNKDAALKLAEQAIQTDITSATAHLAHSYALQAGFDLPAAKAAAQQAVKQDASHALAWARLAELHLSLAELDGGLAAAKRAVELQPSLARTQTILGFAHLLQYETTQAKQAFKRSIELDSADPLARLGNGLATIREGNLQQGRREIEIAASLDTNNSLIRSYLGKAYLEEKRNKLAANQFALAKQMDPKDPTPWLYDALRKQGENDPIGALHNLKHARKLNSNRAVYRSSFLLDSDLATKGANLGRIYQNLGFDQVVVQEASKSITLDPNNYSAHRLLSDSYLSKPRHEIARVSELLQSQLLQPININPLQSQVAESGLTLLNNLGGAGGLNEYSSLFLRDKQQANINALVAEKKTRAYEGIISGVLGNSSMSFSRYRYETDGFHANNGREEDIYDFFLQSSLDNKLSVLFEVSKNNKLTGDEYRFDPMNFNAGFTSETNIDRKRIGFRYQYNAYGNILATYLQHKRHSFNVTPFPPFGNFETEEDQDSSSYEVRWGMSGGHYSLVAGAGKTDFEQLSEDILSGFSFGLTTNNVEEENYYLYSYFDINKNINVQLGLSHDRYAIDNNTTKKLNPKLGVSWAVSDKDEIRLAYFKTFRRSLLNDQTIEPTNVVGFNQFYNEPVRSRSEQASLALDHVFNNNLHGGFEWIKRKIDVTYEDQTVFPSVDRIANWREDFGSLYINWLPTSKIAIATRFEYEDFQRDNLDVASQGYTNVKTYRLPIQFSFFQGNYKTQLMASYVDQEGDFVDQLTFLSTPGSDEFWVFDARMDYMFKKNRGYLTLGVKNLFDSNFHYQETDPKKPRFSPDRLGYVSVNLVF